MTTSSYKPPRANYLYKGDCLAGLAELPDGVVDLAFADPPFNIGYEYDIYEDRKSAQEYLDWSKRWITEVARVLKPDGTFWLAIGDEYAAELKVIAHREVGFVKDSAQFTFRDQEIRVPSARQLVYADKRANPMGRLPDDTWILRPQDVPDGFTAEEDTWHVPRVCGTFKERAGWHGCQMPEQVLGRIIRCCSEPGALVLDPFAGSGTTLVVARKLGRHYIGCELSEEYAARVESRLAAIEPGQPLDGSDAPLAPIRRQRDPASAAKPRARKSKPAEK